MHLVIKINPHLNPPHQAGIFLHTPLIIEVCGKLDTYLLFKSCSKYDHCKARFTRYKVVFKNCLVQDFIKKNLI